MLHLLAIVVCVVSSCSQCSNSTDCCYDSPACCVLQTKKRRGRYNPRHPVQESASAEATFTEEEQPVPASRNVDVDDVNESPLEPVSHHTYSYSE